MPELKKRIKITVNVTIEESKAKEYASNLETIAKNFSPKNIATIAKIAESDLMRGEAVKAMEEYVG